MGEQITSKLEFVHVTLKVSCQTTYLNSLVHFRRLEKKFKFNEICIDNLTRLNMLFTPSIPAKADL